MSQSSPAENQHELEEFRKQWRQEVQSRSKAHFENQLRQQPRSSMHSAGSGDVIPPSFLQTCSLECDPPAMDDADAPEDNTTQEETEEKKKSAMDHYIVAVDKERQGKIGPGNLILDKTGNAFPGALFAAAACAHLYIYTISFLSPGSIPNRIQDGPRY